MPRGRAQVSSVCTTLPARSRIVSVLLFSLETKTLPVALARTGGVCAKVIDSSTLKNAASLLPQRAGPPRPGRGCGGHSVGARRCAARLVKGCYSGLEAELDGTYLEEPGIGNDDVVSDCAASIGHDCRARCWLWHGRCRGPSQSARVPRAGAALWRGQAIGRRSTTEYLSFASGTERLRRAGARAHQGWGFRARAPA